MRVFSIGIGHPQAVTGARLGHIGNARRENAALARELLVDEIGNAVCHQAQVALGHDKTLPSQVLPLDHIPQPKRKGSRYTPVIRRADKPDAVAWFIRHHPEVPDAQIIKLIGTTKATINNVRDKSHWNAQNIRPVDPVTLGLCSQIDLDFEVGRASKDRPQSMVDTGATLLPAELTTAPEPPTKKGAIDVDAVFAKLKTLKRDDTDDEI